MNDILKNLPKYERESDVFINIINAFGEQHLNFLEEIKEISRQIDVDSATWGLDIYEKELGIKANAELDIKLRRELIKAKMNIRPPASKKQMIAMLRNFVKDADIKEYFERYEFEVLLKTNKKISESLVHIEKLIEEFKPAHLNFIFNICYLNLIDIKNRYNVYFTAPYKIAGTIDVNGNSILTTKAIGEKDTIISDSHRYENKYRTVKEYLETILSTGKHSSFIIDDNSISYNTKMFFKTSEESSISSLGDINNEKINYTMSKFNLYSSTCSENTSCRKE